MMLLKACPRCRRGDLVVEDEEFGPVVNCLQCGFVGDLRLLRHGILGPALIRPAADREGRPAA